MMHKASSNIEQVPYCFSRSSIRFQGHMGTKHIRFRPKLSVSGLELEFTDGFEMLHKAWHSIEEVSYCFSRSSIKFQGHRGQKIAYFDPNWSFLDCNSSLNSPMALKCWNDAQILMLYWRDALLFSRSSIKFQGHRGRKIVDFDPIWTFPGCNSSLNPMMAMKCYTKL